MLSLPVPEIKFDKLIFDDYMTGTRVVHCKKEKYDIYIGRPSIWGNLFSHKENTLAKYKVSNVEESVLAYAEWVVGQEELINRLHELYGKTLGCWCKPNPCHGCVLIELLRYLELNNEGYFHRKNSN